MNFTVSHVKLNVLSLARGLVEDDWCNCESRFTGDNAGLRSAVCRIRLKARRVIRARLSGYCKSSRGSWRAPVTVRLRTPQLSRKPGELIASTKIVVGIFCIIALCSVFVVFSWCILSV